MSDEEQIECGSQSHAEEEHPEEDNESLSSHKSVPSLCVWFALMTSC